MLARILVERRVSASALHSRDGKKIGVRVDSRVTLFFIRSRGEATMGKRPHLPHRLDEAELQFHVELWSMDGNRLEKCVGACSRAGLARAMMPERWQTSRGTES